MSASLRTPLEAFAAPLDDTRRWHFYDSLGPYGDWLELQDYGWSWAPVWRGWRRYPRGRRIMTDEGWVWAPGSEGAPAWVCWRHGHG